MNVTCEEFGRIDPGELTFPLDHVKVPAGPAYEILQPRGAEVLATWNRRADGAPSAATGQPAMTAATVGDGKAYYLGTFLTPDNTPAVLDAVLASADIPPLAQAEPLVEVTRRRDTRGAYTFVLNHYPRPAGVDGLPAGTDLLTGAPSTGSLMLEPYGLAVIEQSDTP
jgi:beta-galactosidase